MGSRPGESVGVIYGKVEPTEFDFAASDPTVKRLDYVSAEHGGGAALGLVVDVQRKSELTFEEAVSTRHHGPVVAGDYMTCHVRVLGYRDERGLLQVPRTPFKAGAEVRRATPTLIQKVLGLTTEPEAGAYLGVLKGTESPVVLDVDVLVQKHVSVLAKTGAGKSYTVGVLIEELLKKKVPLVIVDPHGEYSTLSNPNVEPREIDNLIRFHLKPKSFADQLTEYVLESKAGSRRLELEGGSLEAREVMDLVGSKLSSAQQGLLYQAVNELKKLGRPYQLKDMVEQVARHPSNAKWPLVSALEHLEGTKLLSSTGTPVGELVKAGHASILNLKGAAPEIQEVAVARLARILFDARKRNAIPPFMMVVEEAHNFCPERSIASALSGAELRTVASEGRKFGMGLLIVSQRPAKVDKNVLSQCNTQIIMKVTNPNDLKAISASVEGLTAETADEIQELGTGVALVAGGSLATPILVEVRTRQTRHGGQSVSVLVDEEEEAIPAVPEAVRAAAEPFPEQAEESFSHVVEAPPAEAPLPEVVAVPAEPAPTPPAPSKPAPWAPVEPARPAEPLRRIPRKDAPAPPLAQRLRPAPPTPTKAERRTTPVPEVSGENLPRLRPPDEPDEYAVLRVVTRVGYASATSAREAVEKVKQLARSLPTLTPEAYLRAYARVGRTYCFPANPECGPCPLLHDCKLGGERLARGEVREGRWGRKR